MLSHHSAEMNESEPIRRARLNGLRPTSEFEATADLNRAEIFMSRLKKLSACAPA